MTIFQIGSPRARIVIAMSVALFGIRFIEPAAADDLSRFSRDIRPILAKNCFACHGLDEAAREADLRLDSRTAAIDAGVLVPGNAEKSELLVRVLSSDPGTVMPPPDSGHELKKEEVELLRQWIADGAKYDEHWAFVPPRKVEPPLASKIDGPTHAIDRFVYKRLADAGLRPNQEADRVTLLRRVSLDLTGLPPTIEQAEEFLKDRPDGAYERLVDRLLASDSYGEHWARMWLDLARYADTKGYEKDRPRTIWRYRDWVIEAFNRDMPYDQFTIEQLAGDLLPNPTPDQILATAFHRNTMENDEGGTDDEEFRVAAVKDRVDTTSQVWMGLTLGCAKCHSHKYDPISQHDYYSFYAFFNQTEDADRNAPTVPTPTLEQNQQIKQLTAELKSLEQELNSESPEFVKAWESWKRRFEKEPLWVPLSKTDFASRAGVELKQNANGIFTVAGELPEKDTWTLTLAVTAGQVVTAIRLDTLPKPAGGKWPDKNVALRELTVDLVESGSEPRRVKLLNPRADFSQRGWEVAKAIDGNNKVGWAFSPKSAEPHAAIFDLQKPLKISPGQQLRLTLDQEYGQGLVLNGFRISTSSYPVNWLSPGDDSSAGLKSIFKSRVYEPKKKLAAKIDRTRQLLKSILRSVPTTPIMRELPAAKRRQTRIHQRGNFLDQGEAVTGKVPAAFGALTESMPKNRLGVAQWLVHPKNPLTARVAVNRVWARLFGVGLVETEEDFGTQGSLPSHPNLLDWLAVDFREQGWSQKKLLKTIVMSRTYRQRALATPEKLRLDPRNRLLSRGPRFRLSAETVRDQALAAAGLLTRKIGGPSVMPPQPAGIWKSTYSGEKWKNATGPDRYRRAIYTYKKRTSPYPAMITFDAGSGEVCQIRRVRTNTPLQALVTLNDTVFVEAAGALALKMEQAAKSTPEQIAHGFRRVLVRPPKPAELKRLVELYESLDDDLVQGDALLKAVGLTKGDPRLVAVANVILNLDETLMKP